MEIDLLEEIIACLPEGRSKFYYYKDRYVLMLLSQFVGKGMTLQELKKSRFKRLLDKPVIKKILQRNGCRELSCHELGDFWPDVYHCYLLSVGKWGHWSKRGWSYNQISRPGANLVLQLNFSAEHNSSYNRLIKPGEAHPYHSFGHPIAQDGKHTLAWARIDLDFQSDEALIEEIQTDWIRLALKSKKYTTCHENFASYDKRYLPSYVQGIGSEPDNVAKYCDEALKPHIGIWEEAMLAAAIYFLKEEMGIKKIFYHTFDFGCRLKRISGRRPPRSLYTKLPDKFCFQETNEGPSFIMTNKNRKIRQLLKNKTPKFYVLEV